jgi:hypothetical protein
VTAWRGWIAAALLTALAFIGGPDALDVTPPTAQSKIAAGEVAEKRGPQAQDTQAQIGERLTHSHLRLSALLPAPQTAAPVPARGVIHDVPRARPDVAVDVGRRPGLGTCTPEALQIFRC